MINAQKYDGNRLKIFRIMITSLSIDEKNKKSRFFEKAFLLADISIDIVFEIPLLTLSNVEIDFDNQNIKIRVISQLLVTYQRKNAQHN